jgi:Ca2+/Na+ antiporter
MLGGIVAQLGAWRTVLASLLINFQFLYPLVAITVYVALAAEVFLRFKYNAPVRYVDASEKNQRSVSKNLQIMLFGMGFCTLCIFIRSAS